MLDFILVAIKNAFSRPATRNYPFEKRAPYDRQKGHIRIEINSCIFCGMCGRKCPSGAIKVNRAEKTWEIDRFACIMCGACTECCPKKCLAMDPEYTQPSGKKFSEAFKAEPVPEKAEPEKTAEKPAAEKSAEPKSAVGANSNA